ncbi:hypothetical protein RJT34_00544 [Clitoria ternatea]|uniref:Uncharacterized protein n=1 Tax=Clitoria ternatea TaxID=43366 RepID=A0AAN9KFW7_CLITE
MHASKSALRWIQRLMHDLDTEIACIRLGKIHIISVTSPEILREFLVKNDATFASRPSNSFSEYVSYGYLTTALSPFGEQWKKMKKLMTNELLSPLRHHWLQEKRMEEADNLVYYLYNQCKSGGGGLVNVRLAGRQYSGNVIRRTIYNRRYFGKGRED